MQVDIDSVNSNDDNLVHILVLTTRLKNNEATESLVFLKLFKTHSLSYAERNIGSNGFKAHTEYCQNIKTALRSVVEETKILPHIDEFLVWRLLQATGKGCVKLQGEDSQVDPRPEVLDDPSSERPEVYSKLQGKAILNHELKTVRLIRDKKACRDKKSWTIQAPSRNLSQWTNQLNRS